MHVCYFLVCPIEGGGEERGGWGWKLSLREKCPYRELFWSAFSRIPTKYWEILRISPYSVGMRENVDQNNFEYGHFLRSVWVWILLANCAIQLGFKFI